MASAMSARKDKEGSSSSSDSENNRMPKGNMKQIKQELIQMVEEQIYQLNEGFDSKMEEVNQSISQG